MRQERQGIIAEATGWMSQVDIPCTAEGQFSHGSVNTSSLYRRQYEAQKAKCIGVVDGGRGCRCYLLVDSTFFIKQEATFLAKRKWAC